MKPETVRQHYRDQTEKASAVARQLAFAGIAVIWIYRDAAQGVSLPAFLYAPTLLFIVALAADLGQYWMGSAKWYVQARLADKLAADEDIRIPASTNVWPARLHNSKLLLTLLGHGLVISYGLAVLAHRGL